jgi:protein TonB
MWAQADDGIENADLVFVRPLIRVYSVAEPFPTSFSNLGDAFINTLTQSAGHAPSVLLREIRRVNGNDVLALELEVDDGLEQARIFAYLFSNDTETIDLIAYGQSAMVAEREGTENLLDGLVLSPPSDAGSKGHLRYRRRSLDQAEPTPERIKGNVCPPTLRTRIEPLYPEAARRSRETGVAVLEAIIGADGGVTDLMVLRSTREPLLDEAAVRAASQWEYEPATKDGQPVSVYLNVTVNFQLHKEAPTAKK